jgi:hypothetical protein
MVSENFHPSLKDITFKMSEDAVALTGNGVLSLIHDGNAIVQEYGTAGDTDAMARQYHRIKLIGNARKIADVLDFLAPLETEEGQPQRGWYSELERREVEATRNGTFEPISPESIPPFILKLAGLEAPEQPQPPQSEE